MDEYERPEWVPENAQPIMDEETDEQIGWWIPAKPENNFIRERKADGA